MRPILLLCSFFVVFAAICSGQVNRHSGVDDQRLIAAIKRNDSRAVRTLLAAGANPNAHEQRSWKYVPKDQMPTDYRDSKRRTGAQPPSALLIALGLWSWDDPEYYTKRHAAGPAVIKALVDAGANVNERDPDSTSTPLMEAVREEDAATVNLLLRHGANVNATDVQGGTALMRAVFLNDRDRTAIVKLLIKRGANPNAMSSQGYCPLTMLRRAEYIPLLIHYGANINARDKQGLTVLTRVKRDQSTFFPASDAIVQALRKWSAKE